MRIVVAVALVGLGLAGAAWSTAELTDGILELPGHWWSAASTAPAVAGCVLLVAEMWKRRTLRGRTSAP